MLDKEKSIVQSIHMSAKGAGCKKGTGWNLYTDGISETTQRRA
jgi:hypothetical protein